LIKSNIGCIYNNFQIITKSFDINNNYWIEYLKFLKIKIETINLSTIL
jgi:hypothetical protein